MPEKKIINIGTIGHIDHGKTTLTASIIAANKNVVSPLLVSPELSEKMDERIVLETEGTYLVTNYDTHPIMEAFKRPGPPTIKGKKIGRNEICCDKGKKNKNCCKKSNL